MTKLISLDSLKDLDYKELGLKCGLEIHQQLNTGKLFCSCPCEIVSNDTLNKEINRKLRFSLSETGEVDTAALHEFKKAKNFTYKYNDKITCLVDLDEEPPNRPNQLAINTAVSIGQMLNLTFFDKIQFMRKLIINGSVTGGFQRTAMIGSFGNIKTSFGNVSIDGVNIEEDSARTIEKKDDTTIFSLDRQGIPLIEITTGPDIKTPMQAQELALQLGNILRSFKETKRGLGTIRQDLNVSITGGARIEIKGAQNLKLIPEIIDCEIRRQIISKSIQEELSDRKINPDNFTDWEIYDLTNIFKNSESQVVKENLKLKGSKVVGVKLFNFKNILGHEIQENHRFATEVSDKNKSHYPQIKGLFHSDELPKYGITQNEVDEIRKQLKLKEIDSFILIANEKELAIKSLKNVLQIIDSLILEVPSEVRQVDPKGTLTKFLRPMPGSARMYPETDAIEIKLDKSYLDKIRKNLPELYNDRLERLSKDLTIENSKVETILEKFSEDEIKSLIEISGKNANTLYNIIFDIPKDIKKRDNVEPIDLKYSLFESLLKISKEDNLNSQTIRDIFMSLYKDKLDEVSNLKKYIEDKKLIGEKIDSKEIEQKIKQIVEKNKGAPFGALMGLCMKEFNGSVDGKIISEILKKFM